MKLSTLCTYFVAGAVLLTATVRAATPVTITHVADEKKTTATVRITEIIKVVLPTPTPAPAGYEWQIISNDSRILKVTSSPKKAGAGEKIVSDEGGKPAAGSPWVTSFTALRPGRSIVRMIYVQASGSGEAVPADSREIVVNVTQHAKG